MASPARPDKFRRYRDRKRAAGLREVRAWVPDLREPAVRASLSAEIARVAGWDGEGATDWAQEAAGEVWSDL